jgi:hypothetical protein
MKKLNQKHEIFIQHLMQYGDRIKAYQKAYPDTTYDSAKSRVCALMKSPLIQQEITKRRRRIYKKTEHLQLDALTDTVASVSNMRHTIATIINGDVKSQKSYKVKDSIKIIELKPDVSKIIQGLNLNFKMLASLSNKALPPAANIFAKDKRST